MKKLLLTALIPLALCASEGKYESYTYFSVGMENINYSENLTLSNGKNVQSSAKGSSPVYLSGGLIRINDRFDFSMDLSSTLLPSQLDESWSEGGALAQKNQFDAMINSMQFLGHYKLTDNHRIVAGPTYKLNSYKRYAFTDENGNALAQIDPITKLQTNVPYGLIQERVATLYASAGYWYESIPHATPREIRFKVSALAGLPIWNQATNTEYENVTFNSISGYNAEANAYIGYPIYKGLELGAFAGYSYQKKSGTDVAADGHTKWPENTLEVWQTGLSLVWNFSKE